MDPFRRKYNDFNRMSILKTTYLNLHTPVKDTNSLTFVGAGGEELTERWTFQICGCCVQETKTDQIAARAPCDAFDPRMRSERGQVGI